MRAPERHDRVVVDEWTEWQKGILEDILKPNPLIEWLDQPRRLAAMRQRADDHRLAFHHPWRWRARRAKRWLRSRLWEARGRRDEIRGALARRIAPWLTDCD